jgi:hypothetical protein
MFSATLISLLLAATAIAAAVLTFWRSYHTERSSSAARAQKVLSTSSKDVEQQLFDLARLVAVRALDINSASRALSRVWGLPERETSRMLEAVLAAQSTALRAA